MAQRGGRVFTVNPVQRKHRDFSGVANLSPTTLAASARSPILAAQLIDGHPVFQRHPPRPEETAP